jgi:hypothetical protein
MAKKITLEELLKLLDPQIKHLAKTIRIKGFEKEDLEQELRKKVIEDVRLGYGQHKGVGWWFLRLKWFMIYIYRREVREPLTKSITIETLLDNSEEYKNKKRAGIRKKKRVDYRGFCLHIKEYDKLGITYGLNDLRRLARIYNCPIPKKFRQKGDK